MAGLIPLTSHDTGDGRGVHIDKPAPDVLQSVLMALDDVNRNRHILPNHNLELDWSDTKVRDSLTSRRFQFILIAVTFV